MELYVIVICAIFIFVIKIIHWLIAHDTIINLCKKRRESILKNGLVHYTLLDKASLIIKENRLNGNLDYKSTFPSHRMDKIVWFMSNEDYLLDKFCRWCVLRRHAPNKRGKSNHKVKYEVKLLIKGFTDEQIDKMKMNIELGIGCYADEVKNISISYADLDFVDRILGVKGK